MFQQPSSIQFTLPSWLEGFAQAHPFQQTVTDRMAFVIEASQRNIEEGTGGPFAAAIFEKESGKLVSLGVNLVTTEGLSILHAEIVACSIAQKKLNTYDLGNTLLPTHELVTSTEPCAMCLGSIPWSGVKYVVTGATDADARNIGFDEGAKIANWQDALRQRGIDVVTGIHREKAARVLEHYLARQGNIYNSRNA
ncbi:MAG: nucleoside deaminase [Pseudomonadota bacterium]